MTVDLNRYLLSKEFIQQYILRDDGFKFSEKLSFIAIASNVPVIVCCFYSGEVLGWTNEVLSMIDMLTKFYDYRDFIGIPEGYPKERL